MSSIHPPKAPAVVAPRVPWLLHVAVLLAVLGALLAMVSSGSNDRLGRALALAFFFVPVAVSYVIVSTALVAAVHAGSRRRLRGWQCVALAHVLGLTAAGGTALFWIKGG